MKSAELVLKEERKLYLAYRNSKLGSKSKSKLNFDNAKLPFDSASCAIDSSAKMIIDNAVDSVISGEACKCSLGNSNTQKEVFKKIRVIGNYLTLVLPYLVPKWRLRCNPTQTN